MHNSESHMISSVMLSCRLEPGLETDTAHFHI